MKIKNKSCTRNVFQFKSGQDVTLVEFVCIYLLCTQNKSQSIRLPVNYYNVITLTSLDGYFSE